MNTTFDITGLILAGGAGRRVGGRDKGLIVWRGKTLVEHVFLLLQGQVKEIIISCNRNSSTYQQYGTATVADSREDFQGPLAGIEAASPLIRTDLLIVVACDTPQLPNDLVARLIAPLCTPGGNALQVCYANDGTRSQYLCAAMRRTCLPSLTRFLNKGHRAVHGWYDSLNTTSVDFSDQPGAFCNFNEAQ